ncbi:MAG: hypothetical protein RBU45_03950 [Myxococcota bacterium]|nr:hypothetical protein [Myxococcota bacterium]
MTPASSLGLLPLLCRALGVVLLVLVPLGLRRGAGAGALLAVVLLATGSALPPAAPVALTWTGLLGEGVIGLLFGAVAGLPLLGLLVAARLLGEALGEVGWPVATPGEAGSARLATAGVLLVTSLWLGSGGAGPLLQLWLRLAWLLPPGTLRAGGLLGQPPQGPLGEALGEALAQGTWLALPFLALAGGSWLLLGLLTRPRLPRILLGHGEVGPSLVVLAGLVVWILGGLPGLEPLFDAGLLGLLGLIHALSAAASGSSPF